MTSRDKRGRAAKGDRRKRIGGQIKSAEFHVRLETRARAAYEEYAQGSVKMYNTRGAGWKARVRLARVSSLDEY